MRTDFPVHTSPALVPPQFSGGSVQQFSGGFDSYCPHNPQNRSSKIPGVYTVRWEPIGDAGVSVGRGYAADQKL